MGDDVMSSVSTSKGVLCHSNMSQKRNQILRACQAKIHFPEATSSAASGVHERFLTAAYQAVLRKLDEFDLRGLSNLAWAVAVSGAPLLPLNRLAASVPWCFDEL